MVGKYRLLLAFWGALFLVSALILLVNMQALSAETGALLPFPGDNQQTESVEPGDKPGSEDQATQWSLILSTVSAFISAAGFMTTTYFAMRSDRRQTALTELEIEKLAEEIERQRLEIERLRRAQQLERDRK
jgi:hypothetical protein